MSDTLFFICVVISLSGYAFLHYTFLVMAENIKQIKKHLNIEDDND